jgi:hypothetical protein
VTSQGGAGGQRSSQDPADRLIRALLDTGRTANQNDLDTIRRRIAGAPFNVRPIAVPSSLVGHVYRGQVIPSVADSLSVHLWRRVLVDEQWAPGTTSADYLDDLRRAVREPGARLAIYLLRQSPQAIVVGPSSVPEARRGPRAGAWIVVPYSVNGGMLTSGYQVHDLASVTLPSRTRWLI